MQCLDLAAGESGGADQGDQGGVAAASDPDWPSPDRDDSQGVGDLIGIETGRPFRAEEVVERRGDTRGPVSGGVMNRVDGVDPSASGGRPGREFGQESQYGVRRRRTSHPVDGGAPVGEKRPMPTHGRPGRGWFG
jgi:hypothetical protein